MRWVKINTSVSIKHEENICGIYIRNCRLKLPNKIYKKLQKYINNTYDPLDFDSFIIAHLEEGNTNISIVNKNTPTKEFPIPSWLFAYIINFANYSIFEFLPRMTFSPRVYKPSAPRYVKLFPKFRQYNRAILRTDEDPVTECIFQDDIHVGIINISPCDKTFG